MSCTELLFADEQTAQVVAADRERDHRDGRWPTAGWCEGAPAAPSRGQQLSGWSGAHWAAVHSGHLLLPIPRSRNDWFGRRGRSDGDECDGRRSVGGRRSDDRGIRAVTQHSQHCIVFGLRDPEGIGRFHHNLMAHIRAPKRFGCGKPGSCIAVAPERHASPSETTWSICTAVEVRLPRTKAMV